MGAQNADIIKFDENSIYASGYGFAPKFVMQDIELSIAAKALYLYFCSLTGGAYSVYPTRAQILNDLAIGKDKYYAAMENLIGQNYLYVTKEKVTANKFEHNVYHLNLNPKQYVVNNKGTGDTVVVAGILSGGAGMISYRVMKSKAISHTEKAVYGYIVSFMGAGISRMPKREELLIHMGISEKTYKRAVAKLSALELIRHSHVRDSSGRITGARYEIVLDPKTWTVAVVSPKTLENVPQNEPWGQSRDTQNEPWGQSRDTQNEPRGQSRDTQNEPWGQTKDTQNEPWGQSRDTQNPSMGSNWGHNQYINTSSVDPTTTTTTMSVDIKDTLLQMISGDTGEGFVEVFETYLESCKGEPLAELERAVIGYISELFIFKQGVTSKGRNWDYDYLECKTLRSIEENSLADVINRIVASYEQSEGIAYPHGWVQSAFAKLVSIGKFPPGSGKGRASKKPANAFHNFNQRDTDYSDLVLAQVQSWFDCES